MRFFDKEKYLFVKNQSIPDKIRDEENRRINEAVIEHMEGISDKLPESVKQLEKMGLHDAIIWAVRRPTPHELVFEVDTRNCPGAPRGSCLLVFQGVKHVEGIEECITGGWVREEVHLHPEGRFELYVVLDSSKAADDVAELSVVADDVALYVKDEADPPIVGLDIPYASNAGIIVWSGGDEPELPAGWCLMINGTLARYVPDSKEMDLMRKFARSIGGVLADESNLNEHLNEIKNRGGVVKDEWRRVLPS